MVNAEVQEKEKEQSTNKSPDVTLEEIRKILEKPEDAENLITLVGPHLEKTLTTQTTNEMIGKLKAIDKTKLSEEEIKGLKVLEDFLNNHLINKYTEEFSINKTQYVKNPEDKEIIIEASLDQLKGKFSSARELFYVISIFYKKELESNNGALEYKDALDLYSFIENGYSTNQDKNEDVQTLQNILNKIASSPTDTENDQITPTLESNSRIPKGEDNMFGIATLNATKSLNLKLLNPLNIKTLPATRIESDGPERKIKIKEYTPITGTNEPERIEGNPAIIGKLETDFNRGKQVYEGKLLANSFSFYEDGTSLVQSIKEFSTQSGYDKGFLNGQEIDLTQMDPTKLTAQMQMGRNSLTIGENNEWTSSWDYDAQKGSGEYFKNFEFKNTSDGKFSVTCDEAYRNPSNADGFNIKGLEINFDGKLTSQIGEIYKSGNEVGVKDVSFTVGNESIAGQYWKFSTSGVSAGYKGEKNLEELYMDNMRNPDGNAGTQGLEDAFNDFYLKGKVNLTNGIVNFSSDDEGSVFYKNYRNGNEARIFKNDKGNLAFQDINNNNGAEYNGKLINSSINIGNTEYTIPSLIQELSKPDGKETLLNNEKAVGNLDIANGFITAELSANMGFTPEGLQNLEKSFYETLDNISSLVGGWKAPDTLGEEGEGIKGFMEYKTKGMKMITDRIYNVSKENSLEFGKDWNVTVDFEKLAENFKLTGKQGPDNMFYGMDLFLEALNNDIGSRGPIVINQATLDGFMASDDKLNYIAKDVLRGKNINELTNDLLNRAKIKLGEDVSKRSFDRIANWTYCVENNIPLVGEVSNTGDINFSKSLFTNSLLNSKGEKRPFVMMVHGGVNVLNILDNDGHNGSQDFMQILDTPGKEHFGLGFNQEYIAGGGFGMLLTPKKLNNDNFSFSTTLDAGVDLKRITDVSFGVSDGENVYEFIKLDDVAPFIQEFGGNNDINKTIQNGVKKGFLVPVPHAGLTLSAKQKINDQIKVSASGGTEYVGNFGIGGEELGGKPALFMNGSIGVEFKPKKDGNLTIAGTVNIGTDNITKDVSPSANVRIIRPF